MEGTISNWPEPLLRGASVPCASSLRVFITGRIADGPPLWPPHSFRPLGTVARCQALRAWPMLTQSLQVPEVGIMMVPILPIRKLRHRNVIHST